MSYDRSILPYLRRWSHQAWLIHGILFASLILGPNRVGHAVPLGTFDVRDESGGLIETRQFEDWNNSGSYEPGENSWLYDNQDSDNDGLWDAREVVWSTDPFNPDSDYDGITDGNEVDLLGGPGQGFNPIQWDSDVDGYSDHDELYGDNRVHYPSQGGGYSYYDWDGDTVKNPEDSHPLDSSLTTDWNNNGTNDEMDTPSTDYDGDGYEGTDDSHPNDISLWNDWNYNGTNDDAPSEDLDGDGVINGSDSHPQDSLRWYDWDDNGFNDNPEGNDDGDPANNASDSHPQDPFRWFDWDNNGYNDDPEGDDDGDGRSNSSDSHPENPFLQSDWNNNGYNDDSEPNPDHDPDNDGYTGGNDSHPHDNSLWDDWNNNGISDAYESINSDTDVWPDYLDSHDEDSTRWTDWDDDGLNAEEEVVLGTNPQLGDTDGDGLTDGQEVSYHTSPLHMDSDQDGLTDYDELVVYAPLLIQGKHLDPNNPRSITAIYLDYLMVDGTDSDGDDLPDLIENFYAPALNRLDDSDADGDLDADGISNLQEYLNGTLLDGNLKAYDYDRDGMTDVEEDTWSNLYPGLLNKYWFNDSVQDPDQDGVFNFEEILLKLDPSDASTHGDTGDLEWANTQQGTSWSAISVLPGDTDGDGMPNLWEHRYFLNVRSAGDVTLDPDSDGLANLNEFLTWRHPKIHDYKATAVPPQVPTDLSGGISVNQPYVPTMPSASAGVGGIKSFSLLEPWTTGVNAEDEPQCEISRDHWTGSSVPEFNYRPGTQVSAHSDELKSCEHPEEEADDWLSNHGVLTCPCSHGTADRWGFERVTNVRADGTEWYSHRWSLNKGVECPSDEPDEVLCGRAYMRITIAAPLPEDAQPISRSAYMTVIDKDGHAGPETLFQMVILPGERFSTGLGLVVQDGQRVRIRYQSSASVNRQPVSISDGAGPRYRKVGLNGAPISDSKPQVQNENGEENEETFIDAFLSQLRHSVSDVYVPEPASLIPLSVKRDITSDSWNSRSGLRPDERPAEPFGPCWSSNLCSYVRFEGDKKAHVVDEMGSPQTFRLFGVHPSGYGGVWVHDRQEHRDQKSMSNQFMTTTITEAPAIVPIGNSGISAKSYNHIILKKKFGTTCFYQMVNPNFLHQVMHADRAESSGRGVRYTYARLVKVEDRWGNETLYEYPNLSSLIPSVIRDAQRPGHSITIQQNNGRVTQIRQPNGNLIHYEYENSPSYNYRTTQTTTEPAPLIPMLRKVKKGDSEVAYTYHHLVDEEEQSSSPKITAHLHTELAKITDERGHAYEFQYAYNRRHLYWTDNDGVQPSRGLPMHLKQVKSPLNGVLNINTTRLILPDEDAAKFRIDPKVFDDLDKDHDGNLDIEELFTPSAAKPFDTTFSWHQGSETRTLKYNFSVPAILQPLGHPLARPTGDTITYSFTQLEVTAADEGKEIYNFDPNHAMALKSMEDRNGHITHFDYSSGNLFDDPVKEENALGYVKTFTYDSATRILSGIVDMRGVGTTYTIDHLGRRTQELTEDLPSGATLRGGVKKVWTFGHPQFPGFVTAETVDTPAARTGSYPSLEICPVVTTTWATDPDTSKPGWWRMITESRWINGVESKTRTVTDFNGNKRSVTDARQHTTLFDYDDQNRLIKVTHPDGSFKSLGYDPHGNLIREQDENGVVTFHEYDALNRRTKTTLDMNGNGLPDGRYTLGGFDANGLPSYNGDMVTETTYNSLNLPTSIVDPRGVTTLHTYDELGRRETTVVNSTAASVDAQLITQFFYQLPNVNNGKESGSTAFDTGAFKPVKVIDPRGYATEFTYDALYRLTQEKRADDSVIHKTYNKGGQVTSISDPAPASWYPATTSGPEGTPVLVQGGAEPYTTLLSYDVLGQLIETQYADGKTTKSFYTPSGAPWKTIDEAGAITLSYFNTAGLPIKSVQDKATTTSLNAETLTEYDLAGNPFKVTDALGRITQTVFDVRNRPITVLSPSVEGYDYSTHSPAPAQRPVTHTEYDPTGKVTAVMDPMGRITRSFYDAAGRVVQTFDPRDKATRMTYDAGGNALTTVNPLGQTVTNHYDALGRLIQTTDAEAKSNYFAYDKAGNRILVVDGRASGAAWSEADAFAWAASWEQGVVVPFSPYHTTFRYDGLNRLTGQTFANGDHWTYTHYRTGSLHKKIDPQLRETTHTYDSRHRLKNTVVTGLTSTRHYDAQGRLGSVEDGSTQLLPLTTTAALTDNSGYTYDKLGRTVTETSYGRTHTYGYDLVGNKVTSSLMVHGTAPRLLTQTYDSLNRLRSLTDNHRTAAVTDDKRVTYDYDWSGQVGRVVTVTNLTSTTLLNTTVNEYDAAGRLTVRRLYQKSNQPTYDASLNPVPPVLLAGFSWMHDDLGNVTSQTETWMNPGGTLNRSRVTVMTYDDAHHLKTETITDQGFAPVITTYTYDGAANRTGKSVVLGAGTAPADIEVGYWTYSYNEANQLERWEKRSTPGGAVTAGATYAYDANGNRTSKVVDGTTAVAARTSTYTWDAWDRMRETTVPTSPSAKKTFRYSYDYRMRRVGRAQAGGGLTTQHTAYVFSGGLSVAEYIRTSNIALTNSSVPTVQYVRGRDMGGGVGGLLYSIRGTTLKYNHSNGRGDIVAQSDSTGALSWTASYEAYGKQTKKTGTNTDTQRANSKDEEEATGLLNEGYRYRDLETGVWLSRDPAGFVDGPNLYAYVQQNPWSKFDPDGLFWSAIVTAGFAAYDTYKYATGKMSGSEYAGAMALNGAALLADVSTGGMGGGLAVRALNAGVKVAKVVDKADTIHSTINGAIRTGEAIANGDGTGALVNGVLTAVGAKQMGGGKADAPKIEASARPEAGIGCFAAGTLVATPKGNLPIENIEEGDIVYAWSEDGDKLTERPVTKVLRAQTFWWVDVTIDNGSSVTATRRHRFWVENTKEWTQAKNLKAGDLLRLRDGSLRTVSKVRLWETSTLTPTYNLEVDVDHVFFVGSTSVLVHNGDIDDDTFEMPKDYPGRKMDGMHKDHAIPRGLDRSDATLDQDWNKRPMPAAMNSVDKMPYDVEVSQRYQQLVTDLEGTGMDASQAKTHARTAMAEEIQAHANSLPARAMDPTQLENLCRK